MRIGRRKRIKIAVTASASTAITRASFQSIPAVDPSRKLCNPAWFPKGIDWINVRITTPNEKKVDNTAPIAASCDSLVLRTNRDTHHRPRPALIADPINSPGKNRPLPPNMAMMMNAIPSPGSVACEIASLTRGFLRRYK